MDITHEIFHSGSKCGSAIELEDGSLSITIDNRFMGIFDSFALWNPGEYTIRKIVSTNSDSKRIEIEDEYDLYGMNWGFIPVEYSGES